MPFHANRSTTSLSVQNLNTYDTNKCAANLSTNNCLSYLTTNDLSDLKTIENDIYLKRHHEKICVLKEILSSERKYLNDIKEIVDGYYDEIAKQHPDNDEFIYLIFSNIKEIYEFTKVFYSMLESAGADEIAISNCFIRRHKTFLRLYSIYCQNYKIAYGTTEKLEKDQTIGKIIQRVKTKYGHCLKMATYLQLPVLRITKYHLLLQRYLKLLDKDSITYSHVLEALDLMKQVNDQINKDMPELSFTGNQTNPANVNLQKLTTLFGSILKQGELYLNETKKNHFVIVFQSMFLIKKSDSMSKIMHTISNDNLAFLPKSPETQKSSNRNFTIIDYSQSKGDELFQYTFKAKTVEEKMGWQSSILSSILKGYDKKISENVKQKSNKIDLEKLTPIPKSMHDSIRKKLSSFKRLRDFRYSLKNELKKATSHDFNNDDFRDELLLGGKTLTLNQAGSSGSERRLSEPFQSRLIKILEKKKELKSGDKLDNLLKLFRKSDKISKVNKFEKELNDFQMQCSILDQSLEKISQPSTTPTKKFNNTSPIHMNEPIEIKLNDFKIIYEQLDTSYDEISSNLDESTIMRFEKFLNKKIASSSNQSYSMLDQSLELQCVDPSAALFESSSSKSSINSEEGYYSNHDSSASTLINEKQIDEKFTDLKNALRTYSSPELINDLYQTSLDENLNQAHFNISGIYTLSESENDPILIEPPVEFRETPIKKPPAGNKFFSVQVQIDEFEKRAKFSLRNNVNKQVKSGTESCFMPFKRPVVNFERFSRNLNSSLLDDENKENVYDEIKETSLEMLNTLSKTKEIKEKFRNLSTPTTINYNHQIINRKFQNDSFSGDNQSLDECKINVKDLISKFEHKI